MGHKKLFYLLAAWGVGFSLLSTVFVYAGWKVVIAVFLLQWAENILTHLADKAGRDE